MPRITSGARKRALSTAISTILTVVVDLLDQYSDAEWASMADRFDSRLQEGGMASAVLWFDNVLRDWTDDPTPGDACRLLVSGHAAY